MTNVMKTQVGIIGAGPAGLLLAHLLQISGIDSIVIDGKTREDIEGVVKAGIIENPAVEVLVESGVTTPEQLAGVRHDGVEFHFDGHTHRFDFKSLINRSVWLYPQHETLIDLIAARVRAGSEPLFEHLAEDILDADTDHPRIVGKTVSGEPFEIQAQMVVGADGSGSIARKAVNGSQFAGFFREYPFAWYGILCEAPPSSEELIYSRAEEGFVLISTRTDKIQRMYFQCDPELDASTVSDAEIWEKLQRGVTGTTLKQGPIFRKDVLRFRSFVAEHLNKGNVFLCGDAAHTVPPTGAKGMNLAFSDVLWLNEALREFFTTGSRALIEKYEENALNRIWKAEHFSYWMTSMLHVAPDATEFDKHRQLGELYMLTESEYGNKLIAEGYTGWAYGASWK